MEHIQFYNRSVTTLSGKDGHFKTIGFKPNHKNSISKTRFKCYAMNSVYCLAKKAAIIIFMKQKAKQAVIQYNGSSLHFMVSKR